MNLEERAKKYCEENGIYSTAVFSTKNGTEYTFEILAAFTRKELKDKLKEASEIAKIKREVYYEDSAGKRYENIIDKKSITETPID